MGAMDVTNLDRTLRTIIDATGLLVGLSWEKAFQAAEEAIILGFSVTRNHHVIGKLCMGLLIAAVVLPAWLNYLMPMASKHWTAHAAAMELEKTYAGSGASSGDIAMHIVTMANALNEDEFLAAIADALDIVQHM